MFKSSVLAVARQGGLIASCWEVEGPILWIEGRVPCERGEWQNVRERSGSSAFSL